MSDSIFAEWETKRRAHWPHHYRDVLDKLESAMPFVAVNDVVGEHNYPSQQLLVTVESLTSTADGGFRIQVREMNKPIVHEEFVFSSEERDFAIIKFVQIIGGWEATS